MTQLGPLAAVDAPPAAPPPLSLIAAARSPQYGADVRWEAGGVTYAPEGCSSHGVIDGCSNADFGPTQPSNPTLVAGRSFVVWAADDCSAFGFESRDWQGRARRALLAATPWEVEREFWTGTLSQAAGYGNRFLADAGHVTDITPTGGPVAPLDAVACLEQALGDSANGSQGMIHATRKAAIALSNNGVLRRQGNLLLTDVDTVFVPGVGYPGTAPDGSTPDEGIHWMYATDYVSVVLGDPQIYAAGDGGLGTTYGVFDANVNTLRNRAERLAAVTFDGCRHFGVRVQVASCGGSI